MQKSTEKKIPHGCIPDSYRTLPGYEPGVPRTLVHVAICFYLNIIDTYLQSLLSDHFFHICHQGKLCSAAIQIVIFTVNLPAPPNLFPDPISFFIPFSHLIQQRIAKRSRHVAPAFSSPGYNIRRMGKRQNQFL